MNDRAWEELVDLIDQKYDIDTSYQREEPLPDNKDLSRMVETIEFERDNQKFKIERVTSPAIIDKKTYYHKVGGAARVENVYDPEATTKRVAFYKKTTDDYWNEITPEELLV